MDLSNKISSLRKEKHLTQEQLAELVGVSRQTISKWELSETSPDIKEAKILSEIFNVSLDELVNNNINNTIIEKVSNTEKLAGIIIKILKIIGILMILFIIFVVIMFALFIKTKRTDREIVGELNAICSIANEKYTYGFRYNINNQIIEAGGDAFIANHVDIEHYDDVNQARAHLEDWFNDYDGSCKFDEN